MYHDGPAPVSRRSPPFVTCFLTCFQVKPVLETIGTGGAPVSGIFREEFPLLDPLLAGKADSRNGRREEPPVSGKSAPLFPCSIACSQGKLILETNGGRSPGFRDDRVPFFRFFSVSNGKPILRTTRGRIGIFPPSERFSRRPRTAPRPPPWGRTEGRPGGPAQASDTRSTTRPRRTWRRPRGTRPGRVQRQRPGRREW